MRVRCGLRAGFNLRRLARAVGPSGLVIAVEDNAHLLAVAERKVRRFGWPNIRLLDALDPDAFERRPIDGIVIGYNPPIFLQRPDLLEAAWGLLRPGGRLTAVGGECASRAGRLAAPCVRLGPVALGHGGDWHYWTTPKPWVQLEQLAAGRLSVERRLGFEYILCAEKSA